MEQLVVLNDSGTPEGGATVMAIACALGARKAGIPVTFITSEQPVSDDLTNAGVRIVQIPGERISTGNRLQGAVIGLYRPQTAAILENWIAQNDTPQTIYHLHNWTHFLSPSVFRPLRKVGPRLIMTLHDFFLGCPNGAQYSFPEEKSCERTPISINCLAHNCDRRGYADKIWRSARHIARRAVFDLGAHKPKILLIHEGMLHGLALGGIPADCTEVIRNPVAPFTSAKVDVAANREVLFVGRLTYEKGPDLALQAAQKAGLPIRLVGDGAMKADLEAAAPDASFEGWANRDKIAQLSASARMLVMPSRWAEPYGLVACEALWSGIPVIVSDNAFIAQEVAASGGGIACDTRDVDAFAHHMSVIGRDDAIARQMSDSAFSNSRTIGNTVAAWEARHLEVYEERLAQAASSPARESHALPHAAL